MYAIDPLAVSRYWKRHTVARAKSDHADAVVLANILRTDASAHRLLPSDTELVQAIAVLARGGQDAAWNRQQIANQLRSLLRNYFPAAIEAFKDMKSGLVRLPSAQNRRDGGQAQGRGVRVRSIA
jgi:Transposase